jgi:dienelactone hydrolase
VSQARTVVRHGEWPSPISAELVAAASGGLTWPAVVGEETWWCASDPATATVRLVRCLVGQSASPVLPVGPSVRNRSLGYGGRPYLVLPGSAGHLLVFTDHRDQRLYAVDVPALAGAGPHEAGDPRPLTAPDPEGTETCYADPVPAPGGDEVWCVREVTTGGTVSRQIVAVPLDGSGAVRTVATSHHFLSGARVSPDGRRLSWIGWDHPAMPWDGTQLVVADLVDGVATGARVVLGGPQVSVPQVEWADADTLYAMADPDGWWNLHRVELGADRAECVLPMPEECAGALWRVGPSWFAVTAAGVVLRHGVGDQRLALWDPTSGELRDLAPAWTRFDADLAAGGAAVAVVASRADRSDTVLRIPLPGGEPILLTPEEHAHLRPWNPAAQRRTATGPDGLEVHYVYYPPTNPDVTGPDGVAPPLLVHAHGGPTSSTDASPDLEFAMFCSRGFAVASVDYGGSTGYGRAYRERLRHTWGIVDVADCVTVAADLAAAGLADPAATAIRGGSAGGWTSLACLSSTDTFAAGVVYYPISDPASWLGPATHDFESQYVLGLVGDPVADAGHYARVSPLANVGKISSPLVMLQGADDFICRPDQAQQIVDAVAARGLWHRYHVFPGEGHGFRRHDTVVASLRAEAELYSHVLGVHVDLSDR